MEDPLPPCGGCGRGLGGGRVLGRGAAGPRAWIIYMYIYIYIWYCCWGYHQNSIDFFCVSFSAKPAMESLVQNSSSAIRCSCNTRFRRTFRRRFRRDPEPAQIADEVPDHKADRRVPGQMADEVPENRGADSRRGQWVSLCQEPWLPIPFVTCLVITISLFSMFEIFHVFDRRSTLHRGVLSE